MDNERRNRWFEAAGTTGGGRRRLSCNLCRISFLSTNASRHIRSLRHRRRNSTAWRRENLGLAAIPPEGPIDSRYRFFVDHGVDRHGRPMHFCRLCAFSMLSSNVPRHSRRGIHVRRLDNALLLLEELRNLPEILAVVPPIPNRGNQPRAQDPAPDPVPN